MFQYTVHDADWCACDPCVEQRNQPEEFNKVVARRTLTIMQLQCAITASSLVNRAVLGFGGVGPRYILNPKPLDRISKRPQPQAPGSESAKEPERPGVYETRGFLRPLVQRRIWKLLARQGSGDVSLRLGAVLNNYSTNPRTGFRVEGVDVKV